MSRIRKDKWTGSIRYPRANFIGQFRDIPKRSLAWKEYIAKKNMRLFRIGTEKSEMSTIDISAERVANSFTQLQLANKFDVTKQTVWNWVKKEKIPPKFVFKDFVGRVRIDKEYLDSFTRS